MHTPRFHHSKLLLLYLITAASIYGLHRLLGSSSRQSASSTGNKKEHKKTIVIRRFFSLINYEFYIIIEHVSLSFIFQKTRKEARKQTLVFL